MKNGPFFRGVEPHYQGGGGGGGGGRRKSRFIISLIIVQAGGWPMLSWTFWVLYTMQKDRVLHEGLTLMCSAWKVRWVWVEGRMLKGGWRPRGGGMLCTEGKIAANNGRLWCRIVYIFSTYHTVKMVLRYPCNSLIYIGWQLCSRKVGTLPGYQGTCTNQDMYQTNMNTRIR